MTTLEEGTIRALERDIIDHPHEDRYRLIYADWLEDHGGSVKAEHMRGQTTAQDCRQALWVGGVMVGLFPGKLRLGFVEMLRMSLADWRQYGPRFVREHPLTRVELSDRRPVLGDAGSGNEGKSGWFDEEGGADPEDLPFGLWSLLPGGDRCGMVYWKFYPSDPDALDALSAALLAWARLPENAPRAD